MNNNDKNNTNKNNVDENLVWQEINTEHIVKDEWIDFKRSAYRLPDGTVFEPYYSYSRKNYVVIVAEDEEGNYLCVRQYRQGIGKVTTEFPAGGIEVKDTKSCEGKSCVAPEDKCRKNNRNSDIATVNAEAINDALEAAKRELKEETGYESDEWRYLITVPSNATMADNYAFIFEAKNCHKVSEQKLDDTEFLNVRKYSAEEIEEMISKGKFQQAIHIMAWLLAERDCQ